MFTIAEFFKMQNTFNERIGFDADHFATVFDQNPNNVQKQQSKIEAGRWIDDFLKAMSSEMEELRNCSFWKHWCSEAQEGRRYEIKDVEAARKEVIDMFHFWISLAQALGMTPEMVCGMYSVKLAKNIKRQEDGYSILTKDFAWHLFKKHPDTNAELGSLTGESLEDLPTAAQEYYIAWAESEIDGARQAEGEKGVERIRQEMACSGVNDLAWELFQKSPNSHGADWFTNVAYSLEDLPEQIAQHYLNQAKKAIGDKDAS